MSNFNSYPAQPEILHTQMYTDVEFIHWSSVKKFLAQRLSMI